MNDALRRSLLSMTIFGLQTLSSCGGGGGGSSIPPFWSQSGMVLGDFNGDGRLDVARANIYISGPPPHAGYVDVFLQNSAGRFDAPTQYATGPDPWGLAAGDLDGDGHLDLVAVTSRNGPAQINTISDSGGVSILRHDSAHPGQFLASNWIATGGAPESAAIADLNADGAGDLLVADAIIVNGRALLYLQDKVHAGAFLPPTSLQTGGGSVAVVLKDLNGDGLNDIVLSVYDAIIVRYQRPGGGFDAPLTIASGHAISSIAVDDIDGDGRADIVTTGAGNAPAGGTGGANVTILRQLSPGSFQANTIAVSDGAIGIALGDLDGDGITDIATVSLVYQSLTRPSYVTVLLQSGVDRGQFSVAAVYQGPLSAGFIGIGDANSDGLNDIILNDGPSVLQQRVSALGTFDAFRTLR
jgi:hypothetical protein